MRNIFLIGPRASGKTSLGKLLARHLDLPFSDTDDLVVAQAGQTIAQMVEERGWDAFRQLEHDVLARVCGQDGQVVAMGGGMVLRPDNRELLKTHGRVLYLTTDAATLLSRLAAEPLPGQRPALTDKDAETEMRQILLEREPLYRECADHVIDSSLPLEKMAASALAALESL